PGTLPKRHIITPPPADTAVICSTASYIPGRPSSVRTPIPARRYCWSRLDGVGCPCHSGSTRTGFVLLRRSLGRLRQHAPVAVAKLAVYGRLRDNRHVGLLDPAFRVSLGVGGAELCYCELFT